MSAFHRAVLSAVQSARGAPSGRTIIRSEDHERAFIKAGVADCLHDAPGTVIQFFDEVTVLALP